VDPTRWAARFGTGEALTWISQVLEDPSGDLWIVGGSQPFGPFYMDGWFAKLAGDTGAVQLAGTRSFDANEGSFEAGVLTNDSLFVAGFVYDPVSSQQPMYGDLAFDGTWIRSTRPGLLAADENESFTDAALLSDGGFIVVGYTRLGQGGCASCDGTDALAVRLAADRSVMWALALGSPYGDESAHRVIALPGGDFVVFGGGRGQFDYSLGLGTDPDSAPSFAYRLSASGNVVWQRELRLPAERGAAVTDAVLDPATGHIVFSGFASFGAVPYIAEMTTDGAITSARQISLGIGEGEVSTIALAPDGGLFIAGSELVPPDEATSKYYVARLDPSRASAVWAFRGTGAWSADPLRMIRSTRGDLVVAVPATWASRDDSLVGRVGFDGEHAPCWQTSPVTLAIESVTDHSVDSTYVETLLLPAAPEQLPGLASDLPSSPVPTSRCVQ
jgi:hypothetical protein